MTDPFPTFESPPVVEVVCGVQFEALNLLVPRLGQFSPEGFVATQEVAPLPPMFETFSGGSLVQFQFTHAPNMPRVWYETANHDQLIQVQRDRFLLNWRRTEQGHPYPRFPQVYGAFQGHLAQFSKFAEDQLSQKLSLSQLELSYINHIVAPEQENLIAQLAKYLPDLAWRSGDRFLPPAESVDVRYSFALPEQKGRLHMRLQTGIRHEDQRQVLVLELTARGGSPGNFGDLSWFTLAHEWIVKGFCDLTGDDVQRNLWKRST